MKSFDLRSDTLTLPSKDMRKAMYLADVGDDVYAEDPTVNKLQDLAAKITGKRAALFVSSGSMGNLIPLYINAGKGGEILTQKNSHIIHYELSSVSALAGAMPVAVEGERGILTPAELEKHLRPDIYYMPRVKMVEIENSHNKEGGTCYKLNELKAVSDFARKNTLKIHMDGARLFNASEATGIPVKKICSHVDTVTFCLSKGLGAPVGSMLCGSEKFIAEARRVRKMLGGGMRQVGVLAAAGIYALENNIKRLRIDHANAKLLAETLAEVSWAEIDPGNVETNILYFSTGERKAETVVASLAKKGILSSALDSNSIRFVTHLGISEEDTQEICKILKGI
ncbi:MAG: low specificity L-threonine aldolase [Spirochaetes bacterium]|nr:MAG: low specificity L-threonine aldolase [Spirochaetota bacterium]